MQLIIATRKKLIITMNKYIQDYFNKREEREKEDLMREVNRLIQDLEIGEKIYNEQAQCPTYSYPKFDAAKKMPFKYDIGDASIEELRLLIETAAPKKKEVKRFEPAKRSKWYTFATVMIILSAVALVILGICSFIEKNADYFIIGVCAFLTDITILAIVQLLSGIKQGIDTLLKK